MRRRSGRVGGYLNPVVLVGVALSVALGLVFDLSGAASGPESVLAGLVGLVITLLLDGTARAEERFELRGLAQSVVRDEVRELARVVREIEQHQPAAEISDELRRRFRQLRLGLADLRDGQIVGPGSDIGPMLAATEQCRERIDGVTNLMSPAAGGVRWWRDGPGQRYWAANLAALARGVTIRRVFICAEPDEHVRSLVAEQRAAGVDAVLVSREDIDPVMHVNLALWDGRRVWTSQMNAQGAIVGHAMSTDEATVHRMREIFEACWASGRP